MDPGRLPGPWAVAADLAGDASARRYARLTDREGRTAVLVRYPDGSGPEIERDLETRLWCEEHGLRVPSMIEHAPGSTQAVIEDFGPNDAEHALRATEPGRRLTLALRLTGPLVGLARIHPSELPPWNAPLDARRLRWELAGFELWFLRHRCGVTPTAESSRWLDDLAADIGRHPRAVCHRDYHLNNLFVLADGEIGVIDFQDILVGPDTYDIVSMLSERAMPDLLDADSRALVMSHWARETSADEGWSVRADRVRLQRALKVLGTFARLAAGGNSNYTRWMRTLARDVEPELSAAHAPPFLTDLLLDC